MSWADTQFLVALIQTVPALASSTWVTQVPIAATGQPPAAFPYALVHPADGADEQTRFTGPASTEHPAFTVHLVGGSANQCKVVAELVKAKIIVGGFGIVPTVSGRRNQRMYWRSPIPIQTDKNATPPLCFYVAEVGWTSDPA